MTDLLSRPADTSAPTRPTSRLARALGVLRGPRTGGDEPDARPLTVSAAIAALAAVATTMLALMAVAVVGWFLSDAGAHGQTTDALRVGADAWLVGNGSGFSVRGTPLGIVPLTLTALIAFAVYRYGRWAAASSQQVEDDRALGTGAVIFTGLYMVAAVITCLVVGQEDTGPGLGRTIVGSMLLAGVAGTLGMAVGSGRLTGWVQRVPGWVRSVAYGAAASFLLLLAASAVLVAAMVMLGLNQAASMMTGLDLGPGDYVMYTLATMAVAPNAVLLGSAYLLGPGFAVGTGTVVSPTVVTLGPMPAFPLLAALPGGGPTPEWAVGLMAVPVVVAVVGAVLAQRAYGVTAYDSAALRGFGCGFGAALLSTLAIALAGGPMGTGRMADIGAPIGDVLVSAVAAMSLGGLVAGVATAWWQRRMAVGADRDGIEGLARAERAGVPTFVHKVGEFASRGHWDKSLADTVAGFEPDLVVLAGFMKLVGPEFLARFAGRVVNTHPALCPAFPGTTGPADALAYGVKVTGATLFVVDEGVDTGPIIAQTVVSVADDDDVESLHERIKVAERQMLVDTVGRIAREGFTINDRKVRIGS